MKLKKVVIIGMGLIGGSIGKAILKKGLADEVVGVCRRESSLERAIKEKSLTKGFVNSYAQAIEGSDLVIIATPVHTVKEALDGLAEVLEGAEVLVTDVGSTKKEIVDYADKYKDKFSFLGAHPLAGSEKAGVEHSTSDLFENSLCVLTPGEHSSSENVEKLSVFWQSLGAEVDIIAPELHDEILAFTSHLPHIAAYALCGSVDDKFFKYTSTGFKDTTRIASSDALLWSDIFMSNKENVLKSIEKYKAILTNIETAIREDKIEVLKEQLNSIKNKRDEIS
jgi:prephenate dehydrogenase